MTHPSASDSFATLALYKFTYLLTYLLHLLHGYATVCCSDCKWLSHDVVSRLTGRKTEVPTSHRQDRSRYSHSVMEGPVTPFVARLKPFRVNAVWQTVVILARQPDCSHWACSFTWCLNRSKCSFSIGAKQSERFINVTVFLGHNDLS